VTKLQEGFSSTLGIESGLELTLLVEDPDLVQELEAHNAGAERCGFAISALRIGILALRQAQGRVDVEHVRVEGDRIIENLSGALDKHRELVERQVVTVLKEYFDPESGRFNERVERLVSRDGELERLLRSQLGSENSPLVKTLSTFVGEDSRILELLDPKSPNGIATTTQDAILQIVKQQRERILSEFSLDNRDGALARLVSELKGHQEKAGRELTTKIEGVVGEFSLDDEGSALSRLVKRVEQAQTRISSEFSLDAEGSALARLRGELVKQLEEARKQNETFQQEVTRTLAEFRVRREERDRSTLHGDEFEDAVYRFVEDRFGGNGDLVEHTGLTTGRIARCKVGDCVLELGPDHVASGERIVIEAKQVQGYTLGSAAEEVEVARKNRAAAHGVFVFSARTAPQGLGVLQRRGCDVFVAWDPEDPAHDASLVAGVEVARALAARSRGQQDGVDLADLDKAIVRIEASLKDLEEILRLATTIRGNGDKVIDRARSMRRKVEKEIEQMHGSLTGGVEP